MVTNIQAETYHFSTSIGDDGRKTKEATNPSTPWKTLDKLNSFYSSLKDGDVVLFKRGDVFYGSIMIAEKNRKKTTAVTFGAYGTGALPVITGLQKVTNWKSLGNGIYESQNTMYPNNLNMVLLNNNVQPIGRWPKVSDTNNGYLTLQSHVDTSSITSNAIAGAKSFVGGEVVIRKYQWILDRGIVNNQTATTVNYVPLVSPNHINFTYEPLNGFGFFFQNHVNTLTTLGDWCYEKSTKKLKMYFGAVNPNMVDVQLACEESLVNMFYGNSIVFENIHFKGANANTINIIYSTNVTMNKCEISYSGVNGINVFNGYYYFHKKDKKQKRGKGFYESNGYTNNIVPEGLSNTFNITDNIISFTNNNAINAGNSNSWIIRNNVINNTGLIRGMGLSGDAQYSAIQYIAANSVVEYNKIINTGYNGIHFVGNNVIIKNNEIDRFCMVKSDGGGIYTYGETGSERQISGNIISNGMADFYGTNLDPRSPGSSEAHGIYMDGNSNNVLIEKNTSFNNAHAGLFLGSTLNIVVKNNLLYNNKVAQMKAIDSKAPLENMNIQNNTLVARDSAQLVVSIVLAGLNSNPYYNIGTLDYNIYSRPLYEPQGVKTQGYPNSPSYANYPAGGIGETMDATMNTALFYALEQWKASTPWDRNSKRSPFTINDLSKLRFEYNASKSDKKVQLIGQYFDLDNNPRSGEITLAPYASIVLLKSDNGSVDAAADALSETYLNRKSAIKTYPNPSNQAMSITISPAETGFSRVDLLDPQGRPIKRIFEGIVNGGSKRNFNLNTSGLLAGIYRLRFTNGKMVVMENIVIAK